MSRVFTYDRLVEFRDTDASGLMHFSTYFLRMEEAEHALLRSLGLSVWQPQPTGGKLSWPRVSAQCDYRGPVTFEQLLRIELHVIRLGEKSVTYGCWFKQQDRVVAEGRVTAVCCLIMPGEVPQSVAIPEPIRTRLSDYLAE
ncbi:MAG: acyl-CoA thioesterase [Planctomycetota bacterium]